MLPAAAIRALDIMPAETVLRARLPDGQFAHAPMRGSRLSRRANQNDAPAHPASMKRDVSADRHEPWGGDAMAADAAQDERGGGGRRSRAVLISRRWDQA